VSWKVYETNNQFHIQEWRCTDRAPLQSSAKFEKVSKLQNVTSVGSGWRQHHKQQNSTTKRAFGWNFECSLVISTILYIKFTLVSRNDIVIVRSPQDPCVSICKRITGMVRIRLKINWFINHFYLSITHFIVYRKETWFTLLIERQSRFKFVIVKLKKILFIIWA
jgi:hypothetical protein